MALFKSGNPVFMKDVFADQGTQVSGESMQGTMTMSGTMIKTVILFVLLLIPAGLVWSVWRQYQDLVLPVLIGASILGFVLSLVIIFVKTTAPYLSPIYAIAEGVVLGTLSALIEKAYPGIVINAVMITMAIFAAMLLIYTTGLIKVTGGVRTAIIAATGGVALLYGVNLLIRAFGGAGFGFIHDSGPLGIAVSVVICAIAAFNLLLDFEFISQGSRSGAPKYLEWYGAFGLMVTLIWLYLEILRLLAKLRNR
ncbi:MAG: hypothetical protein A2014_09450 [Spirochaetes bacterium GWF1_49_6]|nr:MAG: hypothetical protein A2014_09450 [Spirochaetes bacterium GWF1_49_6]